MGALRNGLRDGELKDELELLGDAIRNVIIINDKLLDALRMKWQDLEMSKSEYYIANINSHTRKNTSSYYPHEPQLSKSVCAS